MPEFLALTSDKDTVHLFVVEYPDKQQKDQKKNPTGNIFNKMIGGGEARSFAKFVLGQSNSNAKCGFSEDGRQLVVITQAGQYFECDIPATPGEMKAKIVHSLLGMGSG